MTLKQVNVNLLATDKDVIMSLYRDSERKAIPTLAQQDAIRAQIAAQTAEWEAKHGAVQTSPIQERSESVGTLTIAETRRAIKVDNGKFFVGADFAENPKAMRKSRATGGSH